MAVAPIELSIIAVGTGGFVIHGEESWDHSGWSVASAGDVNGDGFDDLLIGAYGSDGAGNATDRAGGTYVVFGKSGGFTASLDLSAIAAGSGGFVIHGEDPLDRSGLRVASAGDVNGDGFADLLIGAHDGSGADNLLADAGDSYVVFGTSAGFAAAIQLSDVALGSGGFAIRGEEASDESGWSVASAGDVNGDGLDDLIIGARWADGAGNAASYAGDSYVVFGRTGGFGPSLNLSAIAAGTGGFVIHGQDAFDLSGFSVASAGDVNGDGFDDLVIGARYGDGFGNGTSDAGDSYVVFGKAGGFGAAIRLSTIAAGSGGFVILGEDPGDQSGYSVASAGDVNGDGFADLVIGATRGDGAGNGTGAGGDSYVVFGKAGGFGATIRLSDIAAGTGGFVVRGEEAGDQSGFSVASAGDVNGDGLDDLIIGTRYGDGTGNALNYAGDSYVVFGTSGGFAASLDLTRIAAGTGGFAIRGQDAGDWSGRSVASAGDVDGDGFDDLIVGAAGADGALNAASYAGDSYVVFGRDFLGGVTHAGTAAGETLTGSAGADTMVGGLGSDVLVGAGGADVLIGGAGDDVLEVTGTAFARAMGGTGTDTLRLHGTGIVLDLQGIANSRIQDIERIDRGGTGDNALVLSAREVLTLSGSSNTLRVLGDAGDRMVFADGGWQRGGVSGGFISWTSGQAQILVAETITVVAAPVQLSVVAAGTGGFVIHGEEAFDYSGWSVASAGDVNGDGFADLIIGAPYADGAGNLTSQAGGSYVVFGKSGGFGAALDLSAIAAGSGGFVIHGEEAEDRSGRSVASAGDVNGDGFADLIIGAFGGDGAGNAANHAGDSYVVFGTSAGFAAAIQLSDVALGSGGFAIRGQDATDYSGFSVASAGDVNGDGLDDLIIGARFADGFGNANGDAGDSYVVFGRTGGFAASLELSAIAAGTGGFVIHGQDAYDHFGSSVASAGDLNGDGIDDLVIGARGAGGAGNAANLAGETHVVFGRTGGFGASVDLSAIAAGSGGFVIHGEDVYDEFGWSVASAGDVNGDGFADIIIGARFGDAAANAKPSAGDSYVVFGASGGFVAAVLLSAIAAGSGGFVIRGEDAGDRNGWSVAAAGDVNGDGLDDLIIGTRYADGAGNANSSAGGSYVVFGSSGGFGAELDLTRIAAGTGGFVIHGEETNDESGWSAASAGDVDGDGFDDLIIGAPKAYGALNAASYAGDSYVVFGRDFLGSVTHAGTDADNLLAGTAGADIMVGGRGGDTLSGNGGADVLVGGAGDDVLVVSGTDFARAMGGTGTDTLRLHGTGMVLDLPAIANGRLQDIERIDLGTTGDNALMLSVREVLTLSGTSNTLRVLGDAGDRMVFADGGWQRGGVSGGFISWTSGQAQILVAETITVVAAPVQLSAVAAGTGGFVIHGQDADDYSGRTVASAGDVNGDGFADLIIGAPYADGAGNASGSSGDSYVVFGRSGGFGAPVHLSAIAAGSGGFVIHGEGGVDVSGRSVASAGDVNGDGFADLIIGARLADGTGNASGNAGDSYVVFGTSAGFAAAIQLSGVALGSGGFVIRGADASDDAGISVASAGDVNGDGLDDLIIGARWADGAGNASSSAGDSFVVFGRTGGFAAPLELSAIAAGIGGFVIHGQDAYDVAGYSVASAGDVNGDGFDDLVIGAHLADGPLNAVGYSGASYVVFGRAGGFGAAIQLSSVAAGSGGFVIHGEGAYDVAGFSVASAGDVNGDGFADIIIGARLGDSVANARNYAGDSYVVFGGAGGFDAEILLANVAAGSGGFVIRGQDAGDQSGFSVASAGDVNGDGVDDLIIGARYGDGAGNARSNAGDSYVVFGASGWSDAEVDLTRIAAGTGGFVIHGQDSGDYSGMSVASAGDVDGDGFDDLIIGAPKAYGALNAAIYAGDSYVVFGRDFLGGATHAGTAAADTLTGGAGANIMVGGQGSDVLVGGGGADVLIGGAGDDILRVSDLDFSRVAGGSGTDTLALDAAGLVLNLRAIADTRLRGIERLDLSGTGSNALRLTALEVLRLSGTGNTLRVLGDAGDTVSFVDAGWVRGATAGGFTTWRNGQAQVELAAAVTVVAGPINLSEVAAGVGGFMMRGRDAYDAFGISVASAGDVNGDGFDDLIIGAYQGDGAGNATSDAGDAYVVFGKAGGFGPVVELSDVAAGTGGFALYGRDPNDFLGLSAASAGDINGDGFADLLIGVRYGSGPDNTTSSVGESFVVFGKASGFGAMVPLSDVAAGTGGFVLYGEAAGDWAGTSVASAGDINGDGLDDLVIGASGGDGPDNTAASAGEAYVVFGRTGGFATVQLADVAAGTGGFVLRGLVSDDAVGTWVASAGDVDGDGLDDLLVGAPYANSLNNGRPLAGESYVVFGRTGGFGASVALSAIAAGTGGFVIYGVDNYDSAGRVASAGDINGDGFADILIGVPGGNGPTGTTLSAGETYVVFGTSAGFGAAVDLADVAAGTGGFVVYGRENGDRFGRSVASAGDVNGDGFDDLIVGAVGADGPTGSVEGTGESYVVFGKSGGFAATLDLAAVAAGTGGFVLYGVDQYDQSGRSVASAGDVDGDGFDDLIVGASSAANYAGESYVVFGRDFLGGVSHGGSSAAETLTGTAGADRMVGGRGSDVLVGGGGADVLIGGAGDDVLRIADTGFARVMGGSGVDTLALAGGGMTLDLSVVANLRVQDIERIDLTGTGDNALVVSKLEVLKLSSTSNTLRVIGDAGDSVDLGPGWAAVANAGGFTTYTQGAATAVVDDDLSVACFAEGTRLRTVRGEVAVERLAEGDVVVTALGKERAVRWVGHRTLAPASHPRPWDVQPVRVLAGAFGAGMPVRDLRLSPDHAVFVRGVLIPVRYLLNGATVVQEEVSRVTYFHVELANAAGEAVHDVVMAEGLASESFLDTGNRGAFANGGGAVMLHADFALRVWAAKAFAPLVREGAVLASVRAALLSRAEALGHATTAEPELCLVADGVEVVATWDGDVARFAVPSGARAVRLRSRSAVPAQVRAADGDHRRLGVAVTGLWVDGCAIGLDEAVLGEGWYAAEDGLRWTDGDAELPCGGGVVVEVQVAGLMRYWTGPAGVLAA